MTIKENKNQFSICIEGTDNRLIAMDIYHPETTVPVPIIIFAHGFKGFKDWGCWHLIAEAFAKKEESGQLAQAWYFAGIRHLASGDKAGAAERFRKCVAAEPKRSIVQSFAAAELKWLGEK